MTPPVPAGVTNSFNAGIGAETITFDFAGTDVVVDLTVGARNIKLDVVNGDEVWTDTSLAADVAELHALGIGKVNLTGGAGIQSIYGNKAANVLDGGDSGDTLVGGRGKDRLEGGADADTFAFAKGDTGNTNAKADTIADFTQGADLIDLDAWDANSKLANDQAFTFIDGQAFHKVAGELRAIDNGVDTFIQGDTNGDGKADLVIRLNGVVDLAGGDFAL